MLPDILLVFILFFASCFTAIFLVKKVFDVNTRLKSEVEARTKYLDERNRALIASKRLNQIILESLNFDEVIQKIADTIPSELYFGTAVVAVVDEQKGVIRREAVSQTKEGLEAIKALEIPFKNIEIPINDPDNLMAKAVRERKTFQTESVYDVLRPVISKENSDKVQNIMKTNTTLVYPLLGSRNKVIGVFLASTGKGVYELSSYELEMIEEFSGGVGIAMEHAKNFEELKSLDRMKDKLIGVASHELRTPASNAQNYLWLTLTSPKAGTVFDKEDKERLQKSLTSIQNLIKLIGDILNVSRLEGGKMEVDLKTVDYGKAITEVIDEVSSKAKSKDLKLNVNIDKSIKPGVSADFIKLKEILTNLITNAIKYTEKGEVTIKASQNDNEIVFAVSDTGRGISPENISKLFQMFYREDNSLTASNSDTGGTGLGLYITKSLVELMKGKIWVNSTKNVGSTFYFSLPASDFTQTDQDNDKTEVDNLKRDYTEGVAHEKKKILLVEDGVEMRNFYQEVLSNKFEVDTATDGLDGLNKLKAINYDLILLDLMMPKMDGLGFMEEKHKLSDRSKVPVILLTNLGEEATLKRCFELGAKSMVMKSDILPDQLISKIEKELISVN